MEKKIEDSHYLRTPFISLMTISRIYGQKRDLKYTKVIVTEIGTRGLSFSSLLRLPINENVIWSFQIEFREDVIKVEGTIIGCEINPQNYEYELIWWTGNDTSNSVSRLLSKLHSSNSTYDKVVMSYNIYNNLKTTETKVNLLC